MSTTVNIAALADTSLDYARVHVEEIFTEALAPGLNGIAGTPVKPLDEIATSIPTYDEVLLTNVNVSAEIRPSQYGGFQPKSGEAAKVEPRTAKVKPCKMDLLFTQAQIISYWKTYYGMKKSKKIDPQTFPFEAFIMQKLTQKIQSDLRNIGFINGVRVDAGTTAVATMNGLYKLYVDYVADELIPAGNIVEIDAITATNAVAQFEKALENIPSQHFYKDLIVLTTQGFKRAYEKDYRTRYGTVPYNAGFDKQTIEGSNIEFCVEPGMNIDPAKKFDLGLITTRGNIVWLYDDESMFANFDVDYNKRERSLAYMMDFQVAMDIAMPTEIWSAEVPA